MIRRAVGILRKLVIVVLMLAAVGLAILWVVLPFGLGDNLESEYGRVGWEHASETFWSGQDGGWWGSISYRSGVFCLTYQGFSDSMVSGRKRIGPFHLIYGPWILSGGPTGDYSIGASCPHWVLLALSVTLFLCPALAFIRGPLRRYRRRRRGLCVNCGYNLTGNVSGVCPECGTKVRS